MLNIQIAIKLQRIESYVCSILDEDPMDLVFVVFLSLGLAE